MKLGVSLAIIAAIFLYIDLPEAMRELTTVSAAPLLIASVLLFGQSLAAAWRWHALLESVGARTRFLRDLQIYMSASVANLAFLPQIGSLSVRAFLAVRDGVGLGRAISSLVLERFLVLFTLGLAFALGIVVLSDRLADTETLHVMVLGAAGLAAVALLTGALLRLIAPEHVDSGIGRMRELAQRPGRSALLVVSSIFVLYSGFAAVAVLATGMGAAVPWLLLIAIQPIVAVLAALPISAGGWGVREGGMIVTLSLVGVDVEQAFAISVAFALIGVLTTLLLAALVHVLHRLHLPSPLADNALFAGRAAAASKLSA